MKPTGGDPVASIAEAEATGTIKALYDDIKVVMGAPVVNLIYRHLATLPGCLEWAWGTLRPLYASGDLAQLAGELMDGVRGPSLDELPHAVLRSVGVESDGEQTIRRILDAYNHSNPMNLIALTSLLEVLASPVSPSANPAPTEPTVETRLTPPEPLPSLLGLSDVAAETAELMQRLNAMGAQGAARPMASMYRQLAHWPGYLALAWTVMQPLHTSGELQVMVEHCREQAGQLARLHLHRLGHSQAPEPGGEHRLSLVAALDAFTANLIVEMLPVGKVLWSTFPTAA